MNDRVDYEILNNALDVAIEIGDGWIKVAELELRIEYPDLSNKHLEYIEKTCQSAIEDCYDFPYLIEFTGDLQKLEERDLHIKFLSLVQTKHPWVDQSNNEKLYHRTRYLAWHDGVI